jgi:hypothetical protein
MVTRVSGAVNGVGLRSALSYNQAMANPVVRRWRSAALLAAACACVACSRTSDLPRDPNLETYIKVSARCTYADRAFSNDPESFAEEIRGIGLPTSWKALSDSLITAHGTDARFWYQVYSRIIQDSRK